MSHWIERLAQRKLILWPEFTIASRGLTRIGQCDDNCRWTIGWRRFTNGTLHFQLICTTHRRHESPMPHELVLETLRAHGRTVWDLPEIIVREGSRVAESCEVCGNSCVELHHWAPLSIFEDGWQWPTSWLCPDHHRFWHRTMAAHGLRLRREATGEALTV